MSEWWRSRPVAVVGAGLTGASWAGLFAATGLEVRLLDRDAEIAREAVLRATAAARFLVTEGLADRATAEAGLARLKAASDPEEAYAGVGLVQECVAERLDEKQEVFAVADRLTPPDALLATSSSGLSISAIQGAVTRPSRCLAAHPYNPPHLIPLVELAPGEGTSPATMARAEAFYWGVGKEPVVLARDLPGYVANRLSVALWREAIDLIAAGVASVADVDRAVTSGPGLRWAVMGPHLLYHLGGGSGGMAAHLEQLREVKEAMLQDMVAWTRFPEETASLLTAGLDEEVGARTMEELASQRDEALAAILRNRSNRGTEGGAIAAGYPTSAAPVATSPAGAPARSPGVWPTVVAAPGVTRTTLAAGARTLLVRFDLEPGAAIPPHQHPHEQTGFLVAGDLILVVDGRETEHRPGGSWSIPGDTDHGARSETGATAIEVFSPVLEEFL